MPIRVGFLLFTTLSLLASCGGGGGSSNLIDPAYTPTGLQRLVGGTAPTETATEQDVRARSIFSRSNSRVDTANYVDFNDADMQDVFSVPSCAGATCTHRYSDGIELAIDLSSATFVIGTTVLTHNGITIESYFQNDAAQVSSTLHDSAFLSGIQKIDDFTARGSGVYGRLAGSGPSVDGVWRGMMSGVIAQSDDLLLGDAVLRYSASGFGGSLNAEFTNIVNITQRRAHSLSNVLFANIQVGSDGIFNRSNPNSRIQGGFYGTTHSEATGIFEFREILGAFGTKRQNP